MTLMLDSVPFLGGPLLEAALRSTLLIAIAALAALALRRAAAAVRHLVWTLALVGCVALPLAARVVPGWSLPVLPTWGAGVETRQPASPAANTALSPTPAENQQVPGQLSTALTSGRVSAARPTSWRLSREEVLRLLPLVWLAGVILLVGRYLLGWIRLSLLASRAAPMGDHAWQVALARHGTTLGLNRLPALKLSAAVGVPIVCGARRPTIVLPVAAGAWSGARRDAVLLHELAHVRRLDLITGRVTQLAVMLYWFNPIVWLAARAQRAEAERACDDQVLDAGGRASAYASDLLEIARAVSGRENLDAAALAMARRSQLEGRLLAILDPRLRRGGAGPITVVVAVLAAAGAISAIAAGRPGQNSPPVEPTAAVEEQQRTSAPEVEESRYTSPTETEVHASPDPTPEVTPTTNGGSDPAPEATPAPDDGADLLLAATSAPKPGSTSQRSVREDRKSTSRTGNWNYKDGHGAMLVSKGTVRYNRDLDDIENISEGGWVEVEERRNGKWHKATFRGRAGGIERTYKVAGEERAWNAEGRAWLAQFLVEIDRGSGTFVEQRFPRLMDEGGPVRVLREVSAMTSDYGRGIYLRRLFSNDLDDADLRRGLAQAGREIGSDYELANALIEAAENHALADAGTSGAYLEAVGNLQSDYEHARALLALIERRDLSPGLVDGAIESASKMGSNYEQARVMIAMAEHGHVKAKHQSEFIRATHGMASDYEKGRVLRSLLQDHRLAAENVGDMLLAADTFSSDYERANVLVQLARSVAMTDAQRTAFMKATRGMGSDHERVRALSALEGSNRR